MAGRGRPGGYLYVMAARRVKKGLDAAAPIITMA